MTRPAIAYAWAARRRTLLNDTSASEQSWEDEHSNDPRWSAAVRLAAQRQQLAGLPQMMGTRLGGGMGR